MNFKISTDMVCRIASAVVKAAPVFAALILVLTPANGSAEFYRYKDKDGFLRFTDNLAEVPEDQREGANRYPGAPPPAELETGLTSPPANLPGGAEEAERSSTSGVSPGAEKEASSEPAAPQPAKKLPLIEIQRLLVQKAELEKEAEMLDLERRNLMSELQSLGTQREGAAYRERARQFNERAVEYEKRREAYEEAVKVFNASMKSE